MSNLVKLDVNTYYDITVIGAGPAAISAAVYSARKGLKTAMIGDLVGGQLLNTNDIENIIGIPLTDGFSFSQQLEKHLSEYEVAFHKGHNVKEIKVVDNEKIVLVDDDQEFKTKTIIIATGGKWRKLGIPGENEYSGKGVHYCATCDGPFYRNKEVAIVGGGNSGVEAAIDLSNIVKKVFLVEYLDELKADNVLIEKLATLSNVEVMTSSSVKEVKGNQFAESLYIENRKNNEKSDLNVDGIFVEIGTVANTDFVSGLVKRNEKNEIIIDSNNMTSVDGIFAAGDCTNTKFKQIIIAMGEGAKASLAAFEYIIKNTK
ncbi:FAD-dependent oxidoreductase [Pseudostreptobacillus hongkongensis]|uniref:FAD-dependent oxidoreductase n=1 Tax=Pseudostreptobacillus hongkongensis TaxID=1162717 RepID=UPI0028D54339|nr:FAD-dependent oxidoreductase [Pseudostreptobacillus hongkongensis]